MRPENPSSWLLLSLARQPSTVRRTPRSRAGPHFNVTANPSAEWTAQRIVEAFPWDEVSRYLLGDRDSSPHAAMAPLCADGGWATLSCCNIHGNTGGDRVGCIADQFGIDGNFSADPLFCYTGAGAGDLTLHAESPCAPDPSPAAAG